MRLSDDKATKIQALLNQLPGDMASRLVKLAREADAQLGAALEFCLKGPDAVARERLFLPLKPISGTPGENRPSRSYAPLALQLRLWEWIGEEVPEVATQLSRLVTDLTTAADPRALDGMRLEIAQRLGAALDVAEADARATKRLQERFDVQEFKGLRHIATLLRAAPVLRAALHGLPLSIAEITEDLSAIIRDRYDAACERDPDSGVWVLCLIMARMERPWRLLRVFERIGRRGDDLLISKTDMGHVGDALLDDAAHALTLFAVPPVTHGEAELAARGLERFSAITVGMTREIGIRKDGSWGQRLFALRTQASDQMTQIHQVAKDAVYRATPEAGGLKVRLPHPPLRHEPAFEKALALAHFLALTKDDAARAAVGSAHSELLDALRERLEGLCETLLRDLRAAPVSERAPLEARIEDVSLLLGALGAGEAAALVLRRANAAHAA